MTTRPRCKTGKHRCIVNKHCLKRSTQKRAHCKKGSRKCYNQKCYKINKSSKSRSRFYKKYGTSTYIR